MTSAIASTERRDLRPLSIQLQRSVRANMARCDPHTLNAVAGTPNRSARRDHHPSTRHLRCRRFGHLDNQGFGATSIDIASGVLNHFPKRRGKEHRVTRSATPAPPSSFGSDTPVEESHPFYGGTARRRADSSPSSGSASLRRSRPSPSALRKRPVRSASRVRGRLGGRLAYRSRTHTTPKLRSCRRRT